MFGFTDITIALVYLMCLASSGGCVVYGVLKWNSDD